MSYEDAVQTMQMWDEIRFRRKRWQDYINLEQQMIDAGYDQEELAARRKAFEESIARA